jgi:PAS domain S-box-containing protein
MPGGAGVTGVQIEVLTIEQGATIVGALGAIGITWRVVPATVKALGRFSHVCDRLDAIEAQLAAVVAEIKPNGGGSIKDAIKRIEVKLSRAKSMQRLMLEASDTAHYETDDRGGNVWANEACARMLGVQVADFAGAGWRNCIHQDDRQMVGREWAEAVAEGRTYSLRHRFVLPNGTAIHVLTTAEKFEGGWLGTVIEIGDKS